MNEKQILALDIGISRTGIARASGVARLPEPLTTVDTKQLVPALKKLIKEYSADTVVIGLPRSLDGNDTAQTRLVREWVDKSKPEIALPLYYQDEALTTQIAEVKAAAHKRPKDADAFAAAVILQDFLDTPEAERVAC